MQTSEKLKLLDTQYFSEYSKNLSFDLDVQFKKIIFKKTDSDTLDLYFSSAAVHSSMIEGNIIDFDSYLKYRYSGMNTKSKSFREIEDLKAAYSFASENEFNLKNFLKAHKMLSKLIIEESQYRGKFRNADIGILKNGVKIYDACPFDMVSEKITLLFDEIDSLLKKELSIDEVYYFASMIHIAFAHIHPFADGNGRISRLAEKWFLATKLGSNAWLIQSERLYFEESKSYYKNINLGSSYIQLNYSLCIPFLLMLPSSLNIKRYKVTSYDLEVLKVS